MRYILSAVVLVLGLEVSAAPLPGTLAEEIKKQDYERVKQAIERWYYTEPFYLDPVSRATLQKSPELSVRVIRDVLLKKLDRAQPEDRIKVRGAIRFFGGLNHDTARNELDMIYMKCKQEPYLRTQAILASKSQLRFALAESLALLAKWLKTEKDDPQLLDYGMRIYIAHSPTYPADLLKSAKPHLPLETYQALERRARIQSEKDYDRVFAESMKWINEVVHDAEREPGHSLTNDQDLLSFLYSSLRRDESKLRQKAAEMRPTLDRIGRLIQTVEKKHAAAQRYEERFGYEVAKFKLEVLRDSLLGISGRR
jgi:hypothetical protein